MQACLKKTGYKCKWKICSALCWVNQNVQIQYLWLSSWKISSVLGHTRCWAFSSEALPTWFNHLGPSRPGFGNPTFLIQSKRCKKMCQSRIWGGYKSNCCWNYNDRSCKPEYFYNMETCKVSWGLRVMDLFKMAITISHLSWQPRNIEDLFKPPTFSSPSRYINHTINMIS